jgi:hypothetical protein
MRSTMTRMWAIAEAIPPLPAKVGERNQLNVVTCTLCTSVGDPDLDIFSGSCAESKA